MENIHIDGKLDWYTRYFLMYVSASEENRRAAKKHWIECHKRNMALNNRDDLTIYSAKILASIALAEDVLNQL